MKILVEKVQLYNQSLTHMDSGTCWGKFMTLVCVIIPTNHRFVCIIMHSHFQITDSKSARTIQ